MPIPNLKETLQSKAQGLQSGGSSFSVGPRVAFTLALLLLLLRAWPRLRHPEVWAEDGTYLLPQSLTLGWKAFFVPYEGYFVVYERFLTLLVTTFVSPRHWPLGLMFLYMVTQALIYASLASRSFEWIYPSAWLRTALIIMLCLVPGLNEMLGNMANLNWVLYVYLGMIALKNPQEPISFLDCGILTLFAFSVGTSVLLIPLFFWRLCYAIINKGSVGAIGSVSYCLAIILLVTTILFFLRHSVGQVPTHSWGHLVITFLKTFLDSFLYQPWLGHSFSVSVLSSSRGVRRILVLAIGLVFLSWAIYRMRKHPAVPFVSLLLLGTALWIPLSWVARPGNFWAFELPLSDWYLRHRYSYPLGVTSLFFWIALLRPDFTRSSAVRLLGVLFILINILLVRPRFWIREHGLEYRWLPISDRIVQYQRTGCPNSIQAPIYPDNFSFVFQAPLGNCPALGQNG